ncbi:hypothetical protein LSCM4_03845 [Leishmania orientalis]|uniref:REH2 DRSM domain-containing protein n=1 Tax=Leishmania orientalis TaxID=2249476 RepID=A0A836HBJ1_9TRYP|nr:hypothetical protein LSCM4_03845 [Leishmania orientalis]
MQPRWGLSCGRCALLHLPLVRRREWKCSHAASVVKAPRPSTILCARRDLQCGGFLQQSVARHCEISKTHPLSTSMTDSHATAISGGKLVHLTQVDTFSQSRVKNYFQRVAIPSDACSLTVAGLRHGSSRSRGVETPPRLLSDAERAKYAVHIEPMASRNVWISSFDLPVDVLVDSKISRQTITVIGLAMEAKLAVVAACMHAERCLDALNIPLFTSEQRQHQRVLQAAAEGRTAPEVTAEPLELSSVQLPIGVFLPFATAAEAVRAAGKTRSFQRLQTSSADAKRGRIGEGSGASDASAQGQSSRPLSGLPRRPRRRWEAIEPRYGAEWFLRVAHEELATLQSTILAHNRAAEDDDDDEDLDEMDSVVISADEVQILQPEVVPGRGADAAAPATGSVRNPGYREACGVRAPSAPRGLAYEHGVVHTHSKSGSEMVDETEGGAFDLVETNCERWWLEKEIPGSCCLRDPGAVGRVSRYLMRVTGHDFDSSVQTRSAEEDTNVWQQQPMRLSVELKTWYTMWLDIPGIPVPAVGKATTPTGARDLCAMHAELLLQWFGIHVYDTPREQAMYYDACLRWGRLIAAEPIDPAMIDVKTASLPKPLKEWFRSIEKLRARRSERSVVEKLLHLNRVVVHLSRKHLVELNIMGTPNYAELLSLACPCLRAFMVAMRHPYECAIFCYVYTKGSQYRSTVYLPLPERYGVRGGYSIASTPEYSILLCALHGIDILCALDVVPAACMEQQRWQRMMELRESLGLVLPASYQYKKSLERASSPEAADALGPPPPPPHPRLRSPPAYRDVPLSPINKIPLSQEVWRIMLADADVFDVAPDMRSLSDEAARLRISSWFDFPQTLFEEFAQYAFGWQVGERRHGEHLFHYAGPQQYRGLARRAANNYWMEIPLDRAVYGRRVALGRCFNRRGAERMMYIHALRIAHTLRVTPWDTLPLLKLAEELYGNNRTRATSRLCQWKWVCSVLLDCSHIGGATGEPYKDGAVVPEAEITHEFVRPAEALPAATTTGSASAVSADGGNGAPSATDMRHVLSPHPVMSRDLAVKTMI